jgi:hypothetical protein
LHRTTIAQNTVAQDTVVQATVAQDTVAQDTIVQATVAQDIIVQDTVAQDTVVQHTTTQDTPQLTTLHDTTALGVLPRMIQHKTMQYTTTTTTTPSGRGQKRKVQDFTQSTQSQNKQKRGRKPASNQPATQTATQTATPSLPQLTQEEYAELLAACIAQLCQYGVTVSDEVIEEFLIPPPTLYDKYKKSQLIELLSDLKLKTSGNKNVLIECITTHLTALLQTNNNPTAHLPPPKLPPHVEHDNIGTIFYFDAQYSRPQKYTISIFIYIKFSLMLKNTWKHS